MSGQFLRFTFSPENVGEPIVYDLGRQFGLTSNIRRANVTRDGGWVVLELLGDEADLQRAIEWAKGKGVIVDVVQGDLDE